MPGLQRNQVQVGMKGIHHFEISVLEYGESLAFFDKMFGWLGYKSFWTLDIEYRSTYYMARLPRFLDQTPRVDYAAMEESYA